MERPPSFQFYPRQFSGDDQVMGMDLEAIGAHILLMCAAASSPERYRINADEYAIRMRLRNPSEESWQRIKKQLLTGAWKVSEDGQWWIQNGLERTFQKQKVFSDKQRARVSARWNSKNTEALPNSYQTDAAAMPEPCSSSSSSSSSKNIMSEPCGSDQVAPVPKKVQPVPTDTGLRLARLLRQRILQNNPNAKHTEADVLRWAIEADRMIRLDSRTEEEIGALIDWSQSDPFWHTNILSMGALRKQFDRLTLVRRGKVTVGPGDDDEPSDIPLAPPRWSGLIDEPPKGGGD